MNKLGLVLTLATVAAVSGCLDPKYKSPRSKNEGTTVVKPAEPVKPVEAVKPVEPVKPVEVEVIDEPVVKKPVVTAPAVVEPEFTTYIIQRGDTLSKISKRFNIKIDAIKANNPQIKKDVVRLGQKIKLPGNVDVGDQTVPEGSFAKAPAKPKTPYKAYSGATKEYVVKNGDSLGAIALTSGISVRQLKEMNGLSKDMIRVGQKLKVPAAKVEKKTPAAAKTVEKKATDKPAVKKTEGEKVPVAVPAQPPVVAEVPNDNKIPVVEPAPVADSTAVAPKADAMYVNYTVKEDDDLIGISIRENLSVAEIRELNNIPQDADVKPGMVIKLPVPAL